MTSYKAARTAIRDTRKRAKFFLRSLMGRALLALRRQKPIVIVMVDGGLCSAITKYVLGECFRKHLGMEVKYDLSWFSTHSTDCDGNKTRLFTLKSLFPEIEMDAASEEELRFYKRHFSYHNPRPYIYNRALFNASKPLYLDGYAENWRYFADVEEKVLDTLRFDRLPLDAANAEVLADIEASETSVAVHVRRGDYVNLGMASLGADYYLTAIDKVRAMTGTQNMKVFFFSDDIDWVRANIAPKISDGITGRCVDINDVWSGHLDLYLISCCDHQIGSNSSFGYWGGLLNPKAGKIVIIPAHWVPGDIRSDAVKGSDDAHSYPGFFKLENDPR